jgi:hypothetical protein
LCSDVQNPKKPNNKSISEPNPQILNEILKNRNLKIHPDQLVEELVNQNFDNKSIIDILKCHIDDKSNSDFPSYVENYAHLCELSTQQMDYGIKDQYKLNKFEFLKSGSARKPDRFNATTIAKNFNSKPGFSFNYKYKKMEFIKKFEIYGEEKVNEFNRPYVLRKRITE